MEYRMIAPCYFGAESAAAFDIRRIGAKDVTVTDGRVAFTGGAGVLAAANLHSRCAERILLLLKTGRAETFDAPSPRKAAAFPASFPACRRAKAL